MPRQETITRTKFDPASVLKNVKEYPDETEITLPNGAIMSLGDLREYDRATAGSVQLELEKGRKELATRERKVQEETNNLANLYVKVENDKAAIEEQKRSLARANPGAQRDELESLLESDPVYARLSKQIASMQDSLGNVTKSLDEKLGKITGAMNEVGQTYLSERYEKEFNDLLSKDDPVRPKDLDLQAVYKYASDNGIKRKNGIIDIPRAYDQMTAAARTKYEVNQAYEKGKKEGSTERNVEAMLPRPGFGPEIPGLDNLIRGKAVPKNLNEAFAAAAHDPSMFGGGAAS